MIEKSKAEDIKKLMYEKAVLGFPRFHSKVVTFLGWKFWKVVDPKLAADQITKLENKTFKDEIELQEYCS